MEETTNFNTSVVFEKAEEVDREPQNLLGQKCPKEAYNNEEHSPYCIKDNVVCIHRLKESITGNDSNYVLDNYSAETEYLVIYNNKSYRESSLNERAYLYTITISTKHTPGSILYTKDAFNELINNGTMSGYLLYLLVDGVKTCLPNLAYLTNTKFDNKYNIYYSLCIKEAPHKTCSICGHSKILYKVGTQSLCKQCYNAEADKRWQEERQQQMEELINIGKCFKRQRIFYNHHSCYTA